MKLFLARSIPFTQAPDGGYQNGARILFGITANFIAPTVMGNDEEAQACYDLCQRLRLEEIPVERGNREADGQRNNTRRRSETCQWLVIDLRTSDNNVRPLPQPQLPPEFQPFQSVPPFIFESYHQHPCVDNAMVGIRIPPGPVTNALVDLFGDSVTLQVNFFNMYDYRGAAVDNINSPEMAVCQDKEYPCESEVELPGNSHFHNLLVNGRSINGQITITVNVGQQEDGARLEPGREVNDKLGILKKMLHDEIGSDVVIISQGGKQVKAHKSVLSTHSAVFNAMFQTEMKEAKTHTIEMPDMSEQGVRALLAYLYYWDETEPNNKSLVAFEMLHAGHKYDIPVLEQNMRKLLLGKPNKWYDVDVAMKLFLLARNLPAEGDRLKMKAIKVLKLNFAALETSATYNTLFNENPRAAMELCKLAFVV